MFLARRRRAPGREGVGPADATRPASSASTGAARCRGFQGVWAIGDAAALEGPEWRAKQGHLAEVMARVAAANIAAAEAGQPERESYLPEVGITCLLDMGNGAAYVRRDQASRADDPAAGRRPLAEEGLGGLLQALEAEPRAAPARDVRHGTGEPFPSRRARTERDRAMRPSLAPR